MSSGRRALAIGCGIVCLGLAVRAQNPSPGVVTGRVISTATGLPLLHARIDVVPAGKILDVILTDSDGRFSVGLGDASSSLSVTKAGYVRAVLPPDRILNGGDVALVKAASISGRIVDASNSPVSGISVSAQLDEPPSPTRRTVATGNTNDLGEYRLSGLSQGRYVVVAHTFSAPGARGRRTPRDVTYPGTGPDQVELLAIRAGEERSNIDFEAEQPEPPDVPSAPQVERTLPGRPSPKLGTIRGRITDAEGRGLRGALVRVDIDGVTQMAPMLSGIDGRFEMRLLTGRSYNLTAQRDGFIPTPFGQIRPSGSGIPLAVGEGELKTEVNITLARFGAIVGRVLDDGGEPVEGASVRIMQVRYMQGQHRLVDIGGQRVVRSDDRGVYRCSGLLPGEYVVGASVGQLALRRDAGVTLAEPTADLPGYALTYSPGTIDPRSAQRVSVVAGQDFSGVDIPLERAPTVRVSGTLTSEQGEAMKTGLIMSPSRRSGMLASAPVGAEFDSSGRFQFRNVQPGEYVIQASRETGEPFSEGEFVSVLVNVSGQDVDGLVLRFEPGSSLAGRIRFDGRAAPDTYSGVDLRAVPVDWDYTPLNLDSPASARIDDDGAFSMTGLSGPRVLRLAGSTREWMLKGVFLDGAEVTDVALPFGSSAQSLDRVDVVLTDRVSGFRGTARNARGAPARDATVVVFATDRTRWTESSRFLAAAKTQVNGTFSLRALPPGEYFAVGVAVLDGENWRDPELLESLATGAARLQLSEGETLSINVTVR